MSPSKFKNQKGFSIVKKREGSGKDLFGPRMLDDDNEKKLNANIQLTF